MTADPRYMSKFFIIKNTYENDHGLKYFAHYTNNLVRLWFTNQDERKHLINTNCISLDFIDGNLVEHIV